MISALLLMVAMVVVLGVIGLLALAPLRLTHREVWLPAAPLVGAAVLAVVLHATSWFAPVPAGLPLVGLFLLGSVLLAVRRGTRPWRYRCQAVGSAACAAVVGFAGALLALLPNQLVGDGRVVAAGSTSDVLYYMSESNWLSRHAMYPGPGHLLTPGPTRVPIDSPARAAIHLPLRMGQAMVQSALDWMLGSDPSHSSMALMAAYVFMIAGAAVTAARLFGLRAPAGWALAVVSATSVVLIGQVRQQNQDALLGVGLTLLCAAAVIAAARRRTPIWPAALCLAAVMAVYVEYAVYLTPLIAGGLLMTPRRLYRRTAIRFATLGGLAVVIAPLAWIRGVESLLYPRGGDHFSSPWLGVPLSVAVSRVVGSSGQAATDLLGGLLVVGLVAAMVFSPWRGAWIGLVAVIGGYVLLLTVQSHGYQQSRAITLLLPLALLASVAGWDALIRWWMPLLRRKLSALPARRITVAGTAVLSLLVLVWPVQNAMAARKSYVADVVRTRHVTPSYDAAARWVADLGGSAGADVTALAPDLFQQAWLGYVLRDDWAVGYPSLRPDYLSLISYWKARPVRFLLVGTGAKLSAAPAAVVHTDGPFQMLDLTRGPAVAVVPMNTGVLWGANANPQGVMTGADGSQVEVFRSTDAPRHVQLGLRASGSGRMTIQVKNVKGTVVVEGPITSRTTWFAVPASGPLTLYQLSITSVATGSGASAPQIGLIGVRY